MLEILAILTVVGIGLAIVACLAVAGFLVKVTFKLLLLPLWILLGLFKVLLVAGLVIGILVFAPVLLALAVAAAVLALVALPLLALGGLIALGWGLAAA